MHPMKHVMLIAHPSMVHIAASLSEILQPRVRETRIINTVLDVEIGIYIVRVLCEF